MKLKTYTGEPLRIMGEANLHVRYDSQEHTLPLVVVAGSGPSLFGLNWLDKITLDWGSIKTVKTELDLLLQKHEAIFRKELGTVQGVQVHLEVDPTVQPRFHKPRSVPYAIKGAIEQDLERLERNGIIEKVQYSDWAAPIVPVPKSDGSIRICGDYKVTVNPVINTLRTYLPCSLGEEPSPSSTYRRLISKWNWIQTPGGMYHKHA